MNLGRNQFSGTVPAELGNLASLEWLYLHHNELSGQIPPQLATHTDLKAVFVAGNQLSGCIPGVWRDLEHDDFDRVGLPFCEP